MKDISEQLIEAAEILIESDTSCNLIKANDEWIDSDGEYREFVEDVVPKYRGRYRSGSTEFKSLNVVVRFSGNETKFWFDVGGKVWGRVWSAEDADKVLATLQKAHNMMD